jgi:zinc protease
LLKNATFPAEQLELSRQRALTSLKVKLDDPTGLGRQVFQQAIYPENHPFHSLKSITRDDLLGFYQTHYRPDSTTIAIVGDFDPVKVKALLNQAFDKWQATGKPTVLKLPSVPLPQTSTRLNKVIPGKSESKI